MLLVMVETEKDTHRVVTLKSMPIFRAFCISIALHFIIFAIIELGHGLGWWKHSVLPVWMRESTQRKLALDKANPLKMPQPPKKPEEDVPLIFVEIDPSQATQEPPKDTTYYSTRNTAAANPKPEADTKVPKIDGKQQQVPRLADQALPQPKQPEPQPQKTAEIKPPEPQPLQPEVQKPEKVAETKPEPKPEPPPPKAAPSVPTTPKAQPEVKPGDLAMGTATPKKAATPTFSTSPPAQPQPVQQSAPIPRPRPRTLAMAREQKGMLAGEKMKQEGGVRRIDLNTSLDVKDSPFGAYDKAFIAAVQSRWYSLLEQRSFVGNQTGKVMLDFRLHQDGRITDMRVQEKEVTETLAYICERAVEDPAPFQPFPSDLKRLLPTDYREVRFTFFYN